MWSKAHPQVNVDRFGGLVPVDVLYEFEGPKIFTAFDQFGGELLCYQCGETPHEATLDYLVVPTSSKCISQLKSGTLTVYEALDQPWLWTVHSQYNGTLLDARKVDGLNEVPQNSKPERDATLWAHLMPLFSYRLLGKGLSRGTVPASVIAAAVTKPTAAIKRLLQAAMPRPAQGRPENALRSRYDLLAQRMAFNSFEVSFQPIEADQYQLSIDEIDPYAQGAAALSTAVNWLQDTTSETELDLNLLEVLEVLAPPVHGLITATEIKGRLLGNKSIRLSREDTKRVRGAIAAKKVSLKFVAITGKVRELDRDKRTFILRERSDGSQETVCSYDEEHFDVVFDAFENEDLASIQGRTVGTSRLVEIIAIERVPTHLHEQGEVEKDFPVYAPTAQEDSLIREYVQQAQIMKAAMASGLIDLSNMPAVEYLLKVVKSSEDDLRQALAIGKASTSAADKIKSHLKLLE